METAQTIRKNTFVYLLLVVFGGFFVFGLSENIRGPAVLPIRTEFGLGVHPPCHLQYDLIGQGALLLSDGVLPSTCVETYLFHSPDRRRNTGHPQRAWGKIVFIA